MLYFAFHKIKVLFYSTVSGSKMLFAESKVLFLIPRTTKDALYLRMYYFANHKVQVLFYFIIKYALQFHILYCAFLEVKVRAKALLNPGNNKRCVLVRETLFYTI